MKIFVGNISRESTESELKSLFEEFGTVESINLIRDNYTKVLKGFGFIEMNNDEEAQNAIKGLDGQLFNDRPLSVSIAKPKTDSDRRGNRGFNRDGKGRHGGNREGNKGYRSRY